LEDGHCFLKDLVSRTQDLPLFTSDELPHYADGLKELFYRLIKPEPTGRPGRPRNSEKVVDENLDYATVHKTREKGRVVKVEKIIVFGSAERIEKRMKGLPGKTIIMYARSIRWLKAKFSICVAFYNFIRPHETLSRADDRRFLPKTPAMAAGITDHEWTIQELLACKV
jgi:MFS superfamily sulfate permease-like transporter